MNTNTGSELALSEGEIPAGVVLGPFPQRQRYRREPVFTIHRKTGYSYGKDAPGAGCSLVANLKDFNNGVKSYHKMPKVGNWTYYCAVHR